MRRLTSSCRHSVSTLTVVVALVAATLTAIVFAPKPAHAAGGTGSITLAVQSARSVNKTGTNPTGFVQKGDPVDKYKWLINADDTGDPGTAANPGTDKCLPSTAKPVGSSDPNYADTCHWPSTRATSGFAPIIAQGDETALNTGKALDGLAPGKYLISVTADGLKIDGAHFTVAGGDAQQVTVAMNPLPLPLSTIRIQVFNDNQPVDATWEMDAENSTDMGGFTVTLTDDRQTLPARRYTNGVKARLHKGADKHFTQSRFVLDYQNSTHDIPRRETICITTGFTEKIRSLRSA